MWLERLHAAGWRQAVASSAPPANIDVLIEVLKLGDILQATVSAEEVPHGKPAPDVFLRAAERLGVDPHRSVVVEDAAVGVEAGRRGGMRTIGIAGAARAPRRRCRGRFDRRPSAGRFRPPRSCRLTPTGATAELRMMGGRVCARPSCHHRRLVGGGAPARVNTPRRHGFPHARRRLPRLHHHRGSPGGSADRSLDRTLSGGASGACRGCIASTRSARSSRRRS